MNSYLSIVPKYLLAHKKKIKAGNNQRCHICCSGDRHILNAGRFIKV